MAHAPHPARAAHTVRWIRGAADLIVTKAKGMTDFVGNDELQQPAHQRIRKWKRTGAWIVRRRLREIPRTLEIQHVVEHPDRTVQDLSGAWLVNVRTDRVFDGGWQPANYRMTHILRRPVGVVRRRFHCDDRVLEARSFEGRLPI